MAENIITSKYIPRCDRCRYWDNRDKEYMGDPNPTPDSYECRYISGNSDFKSTDREAWINASIYDECFVETNRDFFCKSFTPLTNG